MSKLLPLLVLVLLGLNNCSGEKKNHEAALSPVQVDELLHRVCARCHNLDMPPKTSDDEKAPPLYTVTVHLKDWMKEDDPSVLRAKFIDFVADYVIHPSRKKSYCDPASLKLYGVMPSLQGQITPAQARAVAATIFDRYDQMAMLAAVKERNRLARLPAWQQVLETRDCRLCHIQGKGRLAPGFEEIARKYARNKTASLKKIEKAITEGSRGAWPKYHTPMRAYKGLTPQQLEGISRWILQQQKQ
ncbi:c-type cytochrome [Nitratifractor sp.]|uniref:c-type cytochrome n=1 Tax=Nitratifractor sp. TaxID=2268144 RepID=UPI0025E53710|nr:c-type cytochrome [Nitratifractor sp.]